MVEMNEGDEDDEEEAAEIPGPSVTLLDEEIGSVSPGSTSCAVIV